MGVILCGMLRFPFDLTIRLADAPQLYLSEFGFLIVGFVIDTSEALASKAGLIIQASTVVG
jgi:hypothetical protein